MSKDVFEFETAHTHIFDRRDNDQPIFSRDCPEYVIRTPGGNDVLVLGNHFKSKRGGGDAQRRRQATRVRDIVNQRLAAHPNLLGDLNDTPDSPTLAPLLKETPLEDISASPHFDDGGFPGTFDAQSEQPARLPPALAQPDGRRQRRRILPRGRLQRQRPLAVLLDDYQEARAGLRPRRRLGPDRHRVTGAFSVRRKSAVWRCPSGPAARLCPYRQ
jgi:endonuclease/exonuclease/phosphatase family metal-dependent hydrolase